MNSTTETIKPSRLQRITLAGTAFLLVVGAVTGGFVLHRNALVETLRHKQALYADLAALRGKAGAGSDADSTVIEFMLDKVIESAVEAEEPGIAGSLAQKRNILKNASTSDREIFLLALDRAVQKSDSEFRSALDDCTRASNQFVTVISLLFLILFLIVRKEIHRNYIMTLIPLERLSQKISTMNRSIPESVRDTAEAIRNDLAIAPHSSEISRLTGTLADFCAEIEAKNKKLDELFIRDEKTNLYNYRHFKEHLIMEIERSKRADDQVSIAMIDLDHFKRYNDEHGHIAGDRVLEQLAGIIAEQCRSSDMPSRFGGEEFAVLFPQTGTETAMRISERLRQVICAEPFSHEKHQPEGRLTVSIGIASFPADAKDWYTLINNADRALYHAKSSGRNRVCSFSSISSKEETP
ncbi:MAG: GGDEF domain-containing protein [Chlorobi bacterium]|nr:GGDEF domain-containing protein [Chlorobiota bacterium]